MWEDLKVYRQLDKADINPTFKKLGKTLVSFLESYSIDQTTSLIKLSRHVNHLEQAIFIEKDKGSYNLKVTTSIKPIDFYRRHKFAMINIVSLGDIMNNHRRSSYPLTQEWYELAIYLTARINNEIEVYFQKYNSYEKIIDRRKDIEPKNLGFDNKYELLLFAAIKLRKKELLIQYLDKLIGKPGFRITQSEYSKPSSLEIHDKVFLEQIRLFALEGDFVSIEREIEAINMNN